MHKQAHILKAERKALIFLSDLQTPEQAVCGSMTQLTLKHVCACKVTCPPTLGS